MLLERRLIFLPEKELLEDPASRGLDFEDVYFLSSDGLKLHGWFIPGEREVTFLWLHGNAGNISHRLDIIRLWHDQLKGNIFIFDYRGYGQSKGRPSEKGTYLDAQAALRYLLSRPDINHDRIIYSGHSLGCAVAVDLAFYHRSLGLILESPFTSIREMAKDSFRLLPLYLLLSTRYDSLSKISEISCSLMVIHGEHDDVVPLRYAIKLFNAAREPKKFLLIPGAGHNDLHIAGGELYFRALSDFLQTLPASC